LFVTSPLALLFRSAGGPKREIREAARISPQQTAYDSAVLSNG
jgi:hypothetical protein